MIQSKFEPVSLILSLIMTLAYIDAVDASTALWIDSDPACDQRMTHDVDDCWALLLALGTESLDMRGISSTFGNSSEEKSYATVTSLLLQFGEAGALPTVYRGAEAALDTGNSGTNPAVEALAAALQEEELTIVALGPLSNIATLIINYPERIANIKQVIAVAGQRQDNRLGFYPGRSRILHVHDFNFQKDVNATNVVLRSSIPVSLVPYEVAQAIDISHDELSLLQRGGSQGKWLGEISEPWLKLWRGGFRASGFHPFDSLAVGLLTRPNLFSCEKIPAKIDTKRARFVASRDKLVVSHDFEDTRSVQYCYDVDVAFKSYLVEQLRN